MATDTSAPDLLYRCPNCNTPVRVSEALIDDIIHCPSEECGLPFRPVIADQIPSREDESPTEQHPDATPIPTITAGNSDDEKIIVQTHPALFRKHPLRTLGMILLAVFGALAILSGGLFETGLFINNWEMIGAGLLLWIGVAMLAVAGVAYLYYWIKMKFMTFTVTSKRSILRRGIISKYSTEVQHDDVRNLQVDQNGLERVLGVGDVAISSSGQDDLELQAIGIPHPEEIANMIRDMQ